MLPYNSERGEVPLTVGGVDIVIAAEMGRLAALSAHLKCQSFADLYQRLVGMELSAVLAAVELLAVSGDVGKAVKAVSIKDLEACKQAFVAALMHHMGAPKPQKKSRKKKPVTGEFPGETGSASPS